MFSLMLCEKSTCPKTEKCYRFRASPYEGQQYHGFYTICNEEDDYRYFIKIKPDDKINDVKIEEEIEEGEVDG